MSKSENNLIWIDLEMTGLDPERDRIIEIATIVTDPQLNILAEGPVIAVHQSDKLLASMDEWNTTTHTASGLVQRGKESQYDDVAAQQATIEFLENGCHRVHHRSVVIVWGKIDVFYFAICLN